MSYLGTDNGQDQGLYALSKCVRLIDLVPSLLSRQQKTGHEITPYIYPRASVSNWARRSPLIYPRRTNSSNPSLTHASTLIVILASSSAILRGTAAAQTRILHVKYHDECNIAPACSCFIHQHHPPCPSPTSLIPTVLASRGAAPSQAN